jgi:hypothetical protein
MADQPHASAAFPSLDAIGGQIVRAAAAAERREAAGRRLGWRAVRAGGRQRRVLLIVIVVVALLAGVAVAATQIIGIGRPVPVSPITSRLGEIVPGTTRLLTVRGADPAGGPPWGLRVFHSKRGAACVQVGRVVDGRLGVLGQDGVFNNDHRFHELPVSADSCGGLDANGQLFMAGGANTQTASGLDFAGIAGVGGCETRYDRHLRTVGDLSTLRAALRLQRQRGERAAARREERVIARYERRARLRIPLCPRADLRDVVWGFAGSRARRVIFSENGRTWALRPSPSDSGAYVLVLRGNYQHHQQLVRRTFYPGGVVCAEGLGARSTAGCSPPPGYARGAPLRPALPPGVKPLTTPPPPAMSIPITPLRGLSIRFTPPFAGHRYEVTVRCGAKLAYNALPPVVLPAGRPRTVRLRGPAPPFCQGKGRLPGELLDATTGRHLGTFRLNNH